MPDIGEIVERVTITIAVDENRALDGRIVNAEGRLSLTTLLDVAYLERGLPASGEGRPGDDRRLAAVDDDSSVVGGAIVEELGDVDKV